MDCKLRHRNNPSLNINRDESFGYIFIAGQAAFQAILIIYERVDLVT